MDRFIQPSIKLRDNWLLSIYAQIDPIKYFKIVKDSKWKEDINQKVREIKKKRHMRNLCYPTLF